MKITQYFGSLFLYGFSMAAILVYQKSVSPEYYPLSVYMYDYSGNGAALSYKPLYYVCIQCEKHDSERGADASNRLENLFLEELGESRHAEENPTASQMPLPYSRATDRLSFLFVMK